MGMFHACESLLTHLKILKATNKTHMIASLVFTLTGLPSYSGHLSGDHLNVFHTRSNQGLSHQTSTHFFFRFMKPNLTIPEEI
ncbi:hypothetical protein L2E82_24589 [Cichorium intybus]|uniref:Uncharacterized protein n=1 Tax=Cichorium intybus TaxID=13427 RepID=A0ACB9E1F3_CICIN|nr:hypothetical protein L2E82_24589 [Cichorium intybus]